MSEFMIGFVSCLLGFFGGIIVYGSIYDALTKKYLRDLDDE
jgi:hypothetical protein